MQRDWRRGRAGNQPTPPRDRRPQQLNPNRVADPGNHAGHLGKSSMGKGRGSQFDVLALNRSTHPGRRGVN